MINVIIYLYPHLYFYIIKRKSSDTLKLSELFIFSISTNLNIKNYIYLSYNLSLIAGKKKDIYSEIILLFSDIFNQF